MKQHKLFGNGFTVCETISFLLRFIRKMQDWETTNERSGNKDLNAHKNKIMINISYPTRSHADLLQSNGAFWEERIYLSLF